ncbi:hypothetical protein E4U52_005844 [Claviceps spartinae]|nr:hypothetical protein E4U52_005844 [Claviceps spartinae]
MAISWGEAEKMHWYLGEAQMRKRGSDDSFSTTCINLTPSEVDEAEVKAEKQQQDQQPQQRQEKEAKNPRLEWSGEEEAMLFAYRRADMSWESISALLPGRTISSCKNYYHNSCKLGPAWLPERKNKLCKLYESLKPSMWAKIGQELNVSWEVAERMHWRLGLKRMAEKDSFPLSSPAAVEFAPPRDGNAEAHQHTDQEHDLIAGLHTNDHYLVYLFDQLPRLSTEVRATIVERALTELRSTPHPFASMAQLFAAPDIRSARLLVFLGCDSVTASDVVPRTPVAYVFVTLADVLSTTDHYYHF